MAQRSLEISADADWVRPVCPAVKTPRSLGAHVGFIRRSGRMAISFPIFLENYRAGLCVWVRKSFIPRPVFRTQKHSRQKEKQSAPSEDVFVF